MKNAEQFIERCPHDEENPYALISRALLRDQSISPDCRWMLCYLLSMDKGWKISAKQLWQHAQEFLGLKKIYKILREACEAGYMRIDYHYVGNLRRGVKYYLSETPKFKNSNNFSDTAISGASKFDASKTAEHKKELTKEVTYIRNPPPQVPKSEPPVIPDPSPPTKEEEEEIDKRLRERPKTAPRIVSKKKWRSEVLKDIRIDCKAKEVDSERFQRHKAEAESKDYQNWDYAKQYKVNACKEYVEFTCGSHSVMVRYDVSDDEWKRKTRWS